MGGMFLPPVGSLKTVVIVGATRIEPWLMYLGVVEKYPAAPPASAPRAARERGAGAAPRGRRRWTFWKIRKGESSAWAREEPGPGAPRKAPNSWPGGAGRA